MKEKGFKRLLDEVKGFSAADESAAEPVGAESPAAKLGRFMLDSLGSVEGVSEEELVEALIGAFSSRRSGAGSGEAPSAEPEELTAAELAESPSEGGFPFERADCAPMPMRTGSGGARPMDYSEMSTKQFNDLRRMLKKASADGRRIKL